ncbi:MAG: hypothetical protein AAF481_12525 [Acidobacteriota bacterium]
MILYERLTPAMQQMVDTWAERLGGTSWQRRGELLAQAAEPFTETLDGEQASTAARGFLTAVLEKLDPQEVDDPYLAVLLAISLRPDHRALADEYLTEHPEFADLFKTELGSRFVDPSGPPS